MTNSSVQQHTLFFFIQKGFSEISTNTLLQIHQSET